MSDPSKANFDLGSAIGTWRTEARAKRLGARSIEELERHLRDATQHRIDAGEPEAAAFEIAMEELGGTDRLAAEYAKNGRFTIYDRIALGLVAASVVFVCLVCSPIYVLRSVPLQIPLLAAHVIAFKIGFWCAIVGGFCGVYTLARRDIAHGASKRVEALFRRITVALCALVFVGSVGAMASGWYWSNRQVVGVPNPWYAYGNLGIAALILWGGASLVLILCGKFSTRQHFLSAIIGSLIVSVFLVLHMIFEGYLGVSAVLLGIVFYALQLIPLLRHWRDEPELA